MSLEPRRILYFSSFGHLRWGGQKSLFHLVSRLDRKLFRPYAVLPTDEDFADELRVQVPPYRRVYPNLPSDSLGKNDYRQVVASP